MHERGIGQNKNPRDNRIENAQDPVRETGSLTPEERTAALFRQPVEVLEQSLTGAIVALEGTSKILLLTKVKAYPQVGSRYRQIREMTPGDWWSFPLQIGGRRVTQQSLIPAQGEETSSCIRVQRAQYYNSELNTFVDELPEQEIRQREGDIASFLGLEPGELAELKYLDSSDALYLVRGKGVVSPEQQLTQPDELPMKSDDADAMMRDLLR